MEYRSYVGRDFCVHWVERDAGKLTVKQSFALSSSKARRGVDLVVQVEGCLKFICRNASARSCPIGGSASLAEDDIISSS